MRRTVSSCRIALNRNRGIVSTDGLPSMKHSGCSKGAVRLFGLDYPGERNGRNNAYYVHQKRRDSARVLGRQFQELQETGVVTKNSRIEGIRSAATPASSTAAGDRRLIRRARRHSFAARPQPCRSMRGSSPRPWCIASSSAATDCASPSRCRCRRQEKLASGCGYRPLDLGRAGASHREPGAWGRSSVPREM